MHDDLSLDELRRLYAQSRAAVGKLLAAQQELIGTRARLDQELAVLRAVRAYSDRALLLRDPTAFWELAAESLLSSFDFESVVVAAVDGDGARLLASSGARPCCAPGHGALARRLSAEVAGGGHVLLDAGETPELVECGGGHAAKVLAAGFADRDEGRVHVLYGMISEAKAPFYPAIDPDTAPGFVVFTQQISALYRNLRSQAALAATTERLARMNRELREGRDALAAANERLGDESRKLEGLVAARTRELSAQNEQLYRASQLKSEFLATMSHELRTPLNAILGLGEALREEVYGPLAPRQGQAIDRIDASGRLLLALINDILDLSKIEAGRLTVDLELVDVDELCRSAIDVIRPQAERRRLRVELAKRGDVPLLSGDPRRLRQILLNLLSNAAKFTPDGGAIGLDVSLPAPGLVAFTVWDTGIGIAAEDLERLFQPFVQLDAGLSRRYGGTGLGLALVGRLTALHGGRVEVRSAVGEGSRFTVELPVPGPASVRP